ncbi:hypothetical protein FB567DRAFT_612320 [Paraphoma chrysanthemicola]|uniref:Uncharacterized protein n=1 Tax=Paraphoma chrysanthemicola TaxID=798071 RepID=A0A8K0QWD3_9PLEO|nr:hypothetical protein FB567DRAFT_612320 [Paraphoma chrysanthemicola]
MHRIAILPSHGQPRLSRESRKRQIRNPEVSKWAESIEVESKATHGVNLHFDDSLETLVLLDEWIYKPKEYQSVLGLVNLSASLDRDLLCFQGHQPMHWDFGEAQHIEYLKTLFPKYREALAKTQSLQTQSALVPSVPFNGRYIIRLLLARQSFSVATIQSIARLILSSPKSFIIRAEDRVLALAVLSEACQNRLQVSEMILMVPLYHSHGQELLGFLLGELWYDKRTVHEMIKTLFHHSTCPGPSDQKSFKDMMSFVLRPLLHIQYSNIHAHLRRLASEAHSTLQDDPMFTALYKQMRKDMQIQEGDRALWSTSRSIPTWGIESAKEARTTMKAPQSAVDCMAAIRAFHDWLERLKYTFT